jgi:predicted NBD/HSP70 family sugar kinase
MEWGVRGVKAMSFGPARLPLVLALEAKHRHPRPECPVLTGTNLVYTKKYNLRIVHEVIRLYGPLSRADVARRTELSVQTVSNLVNELLAVNLVLEGGRRSEGRGAPSTSLTINPDGAYAIGLDLDRDHLTGVLVDLAGQVRQRVHMEVETPSSEEVLELTCGMVETMASQQGLALDEVAGLGLGVPGPMHRAPDGAGYLVNPKAFPGWHDIPLATWLRERLRMPVYLENNGTAAALGERWYGAGREIGTFFYIYFGSGLGGGLILNGQPYEGFTGNAGEIGYLPTDLARDPAAPTTEDAPHVGLHFNMPRLYERLRSDGTEARTLEDLDRLVAEAHPGMLEWMDDASDHLTALVLAIEYVLDPEAICFGGRLSDRILAGLMERVGRLLPGRRPHGKLTVPRHLLAEAGVDAGALGVATLPIYEIFAPAPRVLLKQRRGVASVERGLPRPVTSL